MTNPYPEGTGEHLLFAIFGELPGPEACECGMPTECPPPPERNVIGERKRDEQTVMSDFERDYEIAYHWSPTTRRAAIEREGLRIGAPPAVSGVEDDHRNPWVSVSPTPTAGWFLSGAALCCGGFPSEAPEWDLYEVNIKGLRYDGRGDDYPELRVHENITSDRVRWVGRRSFTPEVEPPYRGPTPHSVRWLNTALDRVRVRSLGDRRRA